MGSRAWVNYFLCKQVDSNRHQYAVNWNNRCTNICQFETKSVFGSGMLTALNEQTLIIIK